MTIAASLRVVIAARLKAGLDVATHCLVMADACEEEGDVKGSEFWRLVGEKKVWPVNPNGKKSYYWQRRIFKFGKPLYFVIAANIFDLLGKPTRRSPGWVVSIKQYRSLPKAILSLEHAWRLAP